MIENGHLVHGQIDASLLAWQPDSFVVTGLLLAVLATVLSYQSTSLAYDLFFGVKQRGQVSAPDMHMLLLADEGSPLSVAAAIFRHDEFDRARFHGDIPKATKIIRNSARIGRAIILKLVLVLFAAPFVNLLSVFLTLERDENVPFSEAGFGPVAFGFGRYRNQTIDFDILSGKCFRARTSFSHAADEHAQFFYCLSTPVEILLEEPANQTEFILRSKPNGQLEATLRVNTFPFAISANSHIDIFTGDQVYRVAHAFSQEDLQDLVNRMALFSEEFCPQVEEIKRPAPATEQTESRIVKSSRTSQHETTVRIDLDQSVLSASQTFGCALHEIFEQYNLPKVPFSGAVLLRAIEKADVTLVDSDIFRVVNNQDLPINGSAPIWFDGSGLTLLKRRTHYVPLGILFIVTGVILLMRLLAECLTNNDVYDGIDEVIARNVGLSNSHALMRCDRLLRYDHKYQRGLAGHYGTPRQGFPEVHSFKGGAVGIGSLESPVESEDPMKHYGEEIFNPNLVD